MWFEGVWGVVLAVLTLRHIFPNSQRGCGMGLLLETSQEVLALSLLIRTVHDPGCLKPDSGFILIASRFGLGPTATPGHSLPVCLLGCHCGPAVPHGNLLQSTEMNFTENFLGATFTKILKTEMNFSNIHYYASFIPAYSKSDRFHTESM